jgi:uncharacterized protein
MRDPITYLKSKKEELANQYGVKKIGVFGSRLTNENRPDSDLDILIELEKPYRIDLLKFIELEQFLSDEIGIKVDLVLEENLKPHIGEAIRKEVVFI